MCVYMCMCVWHINYGTSNKNLKPRKRKGGVKIKNYDGKEDFMAREKSDKKLSPMGRLNGYGQCHITSPSSIVAINSRRVSVSTQFLYVTSEKLLLSSSLAIPQLIHWMKFMQSLNWIYLSSPCSMPPLPSLVLNSWPSMLDEDVLPALPLNIHCKHLP